MASPLMLEITVANTSAATILSKLLTTLSLSSFPYGFKGKLASKTGGTAIVLTDQFGGTVSIAAGASIDILSPISLRELSVSVASSSGTLQLFGVVDKGW